MCFDMSFNKASLSASSGIFADVRTKKKVAHLFCNDATSTKMCRHYETVNSVIQVSQKFCVEKQMADNSIVDQVRLCQISLASGSDWASSQIRRR